MNYQNIKNFGKISDFVFGCEPLGGQDWGKVNVSSIEKAIIKSIELGVNFFDTADVYGLGLSEKRLQKILGSKRHDLFISTKGGVAWKKQKNKRAITFFNSKPDYIQSAVEASLRRLKLDSIPLYYIHWPDPKVPLAKTFNKLQMLKELGKIKYLGCSNFSSSQIKEASKYAKIDFCQLPANILIGLPSKNILSICKKNKIKIVAYNVLASGLLTSKFNESTSFQKNDRRSRTPEFIGKKFSENLDKVQKITDKIKDQNLSINQFAINWIMKQKQINFTILGIKNRNQIIENINSIYSN